MMPDKIADKISITICGDGGCGKSSITLRLVRSQWTSDYDPTIEDSYSVTRTVDGLSYHLSLTDTAGQEEYRGLWASSNLQSDAFLLVYDITNANTLEGLQWFVDMIDLEADARIESNNRLLKERGTRVKGRVEEGWRPPPVAIVAGNKCDLKDARVVQSKTGWDWARERQCGFMETSARDMVNIEETFAWIVRKVVEARGAELEGADSKTPQSQSQSQSQLTSANNHTTSASSSTMKATQTRDMKAQPPMQEKSAFEADYMPLWKRLLTCSCFGS